MPSQLIIEQTTIQGLLLVKPKRFDDSRGFFSEIMRLDELNKQFSNVKFVQFNHAHSNKNVLRGMHAEPWTKFVYVFKGEVFTAITDMRTDSSTFGKTQTFSINDENRIGLFIPEGCAHGYCVISEESEHFYAVTEYYTGKEKKRAFLWNDKEIAIPWPTKEPIISDADKNNSTFKEAISSYNKTYNEISVNSVKNKNSQTIAVIGASGTLGTKMMQVLSADYTVIGTCNTRSSAGLHELDVVSKEQLTAFLEVHKPQIIIHTAALTDLERCEKYPGEARAINVEPLKVISEWAVRNNAKVVFISTDGIFDGTKGNYVETDIPNAINIYGQTKLDAEKIVKLLPDYLILRVAVLYDDVPSKKFINFCIDKLVKGETVNGAKDLIRTPTLAIDIANATKKLLEKNVNGIYNVTGNDKISMYETALLVAEVFGCDKKLVGSILSTELKSIVKRPLDCSMNIDKLKKEGIQMKTLREGLEYIKNKSVNHDIKKIM